MKKLILSMLLSLLAVFAAVGQGMSDEQILGYVQQQVKNGASESDVAKGLMQRGVSLSQIQNLRNRYRQQIDKRGMGPAADRAISNAAKRQQAEQVTGDNTVASSDASEETVATATEQATTGQRRVFGRDIFNTGRLSFEPSMNIPTPPNYVLGPGDQLVVDIYGATQETHVLTISPDGEVIMPGYGPVQVNGLTVNAAQNLIRSKVGAYFTSSEIKTTLGQTRSILVNVMGEVKVPGTYTLSSYSTVFHALYRAGGINNLGTLRDIKVYRQGRLISVVDIYEFILNGRLAGNVRLEDNDVIQVGTYDCIIEIGGHVKRPMAYEMRSDETLQTLLDYAGGFSGDAYKKSIRVLRQDNVAKEVFNVAEHELSAFRVSDGDIVSVDQVYDRYSNMVEIKGAVFRPGMYRLGEQVNSIRTLVSNADGLTEEAMLSRAVLRRLKPNRTQEVFSIDLEGILAGTTADMPLQNEDVLFIPTIQEHQNTRTLEINGQVVFPGTYEYADSMTIEDLILQAGGLTDLASTAKVDVSRRFRDPKATTSGLDIAQTFSFELKENFQVEGHPDFILEPYDIVSVHQTPVFRSPIRVSVDGEVVFRGTYTMERKNQRLSDVVKAAGGTVEGAYLRGARLVRKMTPDERARMSAIIKLARQTHGEEEDSISLSKLALETTYSVGIHLDEALAHPGGEADIEVVDGDLLVIPRMNHTVRIAGDVRQPNTVAFVEGKGYKYYVEQAGGFGNRAKKRKSYIIYQNGTMAKATKGKIEPGCEIIVPSKEKHNNPMTIAQWLGIGTAAASIGTMAASIANLFK